MFAAGKTKGASAAAAANYIEDVFSTYLYTGNGTTQTITNGIDLSGKGGLVWGKARNFADDHVLIDTARGAANYLSSNNTLDQQSSVNGLTAFNSTGFSVGSANTLNSSTRNYASWTFRKQPKFFDVVTYTGNGVQGRVLSHSLGSTPGFILIKETSTTGNWKVWHRGDGTTNYTAMSLNLTDAWPGSSLSSANLPTSTTFQPAWIYASDYSNGNANGVSYVAYLFAHNAGGFGLTGTDNVISCGSYTGTGGTNTNSINLGYEPQWVLFKSATASVSGDWFMYDVMRGADLSNSRQLRANLSNAEGSDSPPRCYPTATGFNVTGNSQNASGDTYIYIAIRRGPMKTPTSGTSVFTPVAYSGTGSNNTVTSGIVTDMVIEGNRASTSAGTKFGVWGRLLGTRYMLTTSTAIESAAATTIIQANPWDTMTGLKVGTTSSLTNASTNTFAYWMFQRAPGFYDNACYTGTGSAITVYHNLQVTPELIIVKRRNSTGGDWYVWNCGSTGSIDWGLLNSSTPFGSDWYLYFDGRGPTSFNPYSAGPLNILNSQYTAHFFASCPGVSKIGAYVGSGSDVTVDCGFTSVARFVLIRRLLFGASYDSGNWWVFDTARGITTSNDPALLLNSTTNEASLAGDYVAPASTGFVAKTGNSEINVAGQTYLYLAIA